MTLAGVLSVWTGLYFVAPDLVPGTLVGTALVLHTCHAIMCRLIAINNGYPRNVWTVLGFVGGIWALTLLILMPRRPGAP